MRMDVENMIECFPGQNTFSPASDLLCIALLAQWSMENLNILK
jgi:hypothetical protein